MQRIYVLIFAFLIGVIALSHEAIAKSTGENNVQILTGEWPPYISQNFKGQGIIPRIIRKAFAYSGLEVEFRFVPWKTIHPNLMKGVFDGGAVWGDYQSWLGKLLASDPIISSDYVIFHLDARKYFNWRDSKSLHGMVMGYEKGGQLAPYFQKLVDEKLLKIRYIANPAHAFEMLRTGKINFLPYNKISGEAILKEKYPKNDHMLTFHKEPFRISLYRLIFSNKPARARFLMERLNQGLQIMRQNGEWDKIRKEIGT
ncbi:exported hypothetical protein [Candidatus Terasakiella magnetica]|uniref:Solute-binding protein family 3/N-terminal domain-containing protein n=1 Tax=Candidatus Terasakiella magnetica TaxID=1867952 RepID=A0A1C3RKL3_9PROT|nr:transporter substrate-binding domain-containing protein [Candidatus Terasakiella magnetica]SCA57761.1 exported hypothetical protein [Candidatus Terasakiella magnetica]